MKITYIHHSSFLAELKETALLFDYFREIFLCRRASRQWCLPATVMEIIFHR